MLDATYDFDSPNEAVQDCGPYLLAMPSQNRNIALVDLPPEVAVVDLDTNQVVVQKAHPTALSTGSSREKARKRLIAAIAPPPHFAVPAELTVGQTDHERLVIT